MTQSANSMRVVRTDGYCQVQITIYRLTSGKYKATFNSMWSGEHDSVGEAMDTAYASIDELRDILENYIEESKRYR